MITLDLTAQEKGQIGYLLPIQGNLKTLELVQQILDKVNKNEEKDGKIEFLEAEFEFICQMIDVLNQAQKLTLSSLSLVHKILNNKENSDE